MRAKGEGTISKRKDGRGYKVQITIGIDKKTGNAIRKTTSAPTQAEATKKLDNLKKIYGNVHVDKRPKSNKVVFIDYLLNEWIDEKRNIERLEDSTLETHEKRINKYFKSFFGRTTIDKIDAGMINRFYASLHHLKPITIHKVHHIINNAMKMAVRDNLIFRNPCEYIKLPKAHIKEKRALSDDEVQRLLKAVKEYADTKAQTPNLYMFTVLALATGLRRGELLALTWDNVDFHNGKITVTSAVSELKKGLIIKRPKTDASQRTFSVAEPVMNMLRTHRIFATGKYVFPSSTNKDNPQYPRNVNHAFENACKAAEIDDITIHMLRHTNITNMIIAGTNLKTVQQRAGHSSLATTMSYTHPSEKQDREAADIFSKFL